MKTFALAGVLTLGLTACGSDEPASPAAAPPASAPGPAYGGGAGTATVQTGETDLGTILTGAGGLTLYVFGADENGESTCYDDCAATWPALTVDGEPVAAEGLDPSKLGTSERTDGTIQVTYAGSPLYYFASDAAPGDTNGQGIGDIWFVVSPEGEPIS
jgi:predicted lipoprotein with Yx(FWY)xxD motif